MHLILDSLSITKIKMAIWTHLYIFKEGIYARLVENMVTRQNPAKVPLLNATIAQIAATPRKVVYISQLKNFDLHLSVALSWVISAEI